MTETITVILGARFTGQTNLRAVCLDSAGATLATYTAGYTEVGTTGTYLWTMTIPTGCVNVTVYCGTYSASTAVSGPVAAADETPAATSDMMLDGARSAMATRETSMSQTVTYTRDTITATVPATLGRSTYTILNAENAEITVTVTDFIIATSRLAAFGDPEPGDVITWEDAAGNEVENVVCCPAGDDTAFRYCDPYRLQLRIHTQPR